jgi:hypothetical protein
MDRSAGALAVSEGATGNSRVLTVEGVLDSSTYLQLRGAIVEAALDQPQAVLVDVDKLDVPAPTAWAVFTSARWLVDTWPAVPIHLVCGNVRQRKVMARTGVTRHLRVHPTVEAALAALTGTRRAVSRASTELPAALASLRVAREFVAQRLAEWAVEQLVPVATVIANVFVENVLQHTPNAAVLLLETDGETVAVSVQDASPAPAARHEDPYRGSERISGLAIVASVCRAWGSAPRPSGKTVWALIGPENRL